MSSPGKVHTFRLVRSCVISSKVFKVLAKVSEDHCYLRPYADPRQSTLAIAEEAAEPLEEDQACNVLCTLEGRRHAIAHSCLVT